MKHMSTKGFRGFTLIELLVVIAIIGLLATVIAAPITEARKKGRDAKKIADIRSIATALAIYADDNGGVYPNDISGLVPRYIPTLPANAATTTMNRDKYMYVTYVENSRNVAYHLGVKLESGNQALNDDADCGGTGTVTVSGNTPCVGISTDNPKLPVCSTACTVQNSNYSSTYVGSGNPVSSGAGVDFGSGSDTGSTNCTSAVSGANSCIYDLVN